MITDYNLTLNHTLKDFLQKNVVLYVNNKILKKGKFVNFNSSYFGLIFKIFSTKKQKNELIKIPIPFLYEYSKSDNVLYFDYRIKTFSMGNKEIEKILIDFSKTNKIKSKFWNSILEISLNG